MRRLLFFLILLSCFSAFSQNKQIDDYREKMRTVKADTSLAKMYNTLSWYFVNAGQFDSAVAACKKAKELWDRLPAAIKQMRSTRITLAYTYMGRGIVHRYLNEFSEAMEQYRQGLRLMQEMNNKDGLGRLYSNIAALYTQMGKYPEAMEFHFKNLELKKEFGDKVMENSIYLELGTTQLYTGQYRKCLQYYMQGLEGFKALKDSAYLSTAFAEVGNAYLMLKQPDSALFYYREELKIDSMRNDLNKLRIAYINYAELCKARHDWGTAKKLLNSAIELNTLYGDRKAVAIAKTNLANVLMFEKRYPEARTLLLSAIADAKSARTREYLKNCYQSLARLDSTTGNYKSAYLYYQLNTRLSDSLLSEQKLVEMSRSEMNYEFHQKEEMARLEQQKKEALALAEKKRQNAVIISVCGILLLTLGFAVFAYRSFLQKKKDHEKITYQKAVIEEKQREILDSIQYARRIQKALLPSEKFLEKKLGRRG